MGGVDVAFERLQPVAVALGERDVAVVALAHDRVDLRQAGRRCTLAYEDSAEETTAVSALIDVEALRAGRCKDTGTANPLLRARWEMYRPFFGAASFYPPNSFLDTPMRDANEAKPVLAASLQNMARAGIIVEG